MSTINEVYKNSIEFFKKHKKELDVKINFEASPEQEGRLNVLLMALKERYKGYINDIDDVIEKLEQDIIVTATSFERLWLLDSGVLKCIDSKKWVNLKMSDKSFDLALNMAETKMQFLIRGEGSFKTMAEMKEEINNINLD